MRKELSELELLISSPTSAGMPRCRCSINFARSHEGPQTCTTYSHLVLNDLYSSPAVMEAYAKQPLLVVIAIYFMPNPCNANAVNRKRYHKASMASLLLL
jgi:hypothetical protein